MQWCRFNCWIRKMPWGREWQPTPVFLPREFNEQRSLAGYNPDWAHGHPHAHVHTHTHSHSLTHSLTVGRAVYKDDSERPIVRWLVIKKTIYIQTAVFSKAGKSFHLSREGLKIRSEESFWSLLSLRNTGRHCSILCSVSGQRAPLTPSHP